MSIDRQALHQAVDDHGAVVRVVVAQVKGSAPREPGTSMVVWSDGQSGTIGGGALEFEAAAQARRMLAEGTQSWVTRAALGPALNQCCGGAVVLVSEVFTKTDVASLPDHLHARPVDGSSPMPLRMTRALARHRGQGTVPDIVFEDGWLLEPCTTAARPLWIYGAGHVGRALVSVLSPLPDVALTWVDTGPDRFPQTIPEGVTPLVAQDPTRAVPHAPDTADYLILTYSHTLDLNLCHALLRRRFRSIGLIGSATKWARFRTRLRQLGHSEAEISQITCPIGDPSLGKHPQAIAVGVAGKVLARRQTAASETTLGQTG